MHSIDSIRSNGLRLNKHLSKSRAIHEIEGKTMRQLSADGWQMIHEVAQRHGFSDDGVLSMLQSVINGNGSMAQFSHPDFAGSGQWMRGGMIMVSDMFNNQLKGRVDSLCTELSNLVANEPNLL